MKTIKFHMLTILAVIKSFFKRFPEIITVPVALVVWIISVRFLRFLDPTAAVFDAGVFQIPIFSIIQLLVYSSIAWLVLGLLFGTYKKYLLNNLKNDFKELTKWQKIRISYAIFFSLLLCLVALSYTLN